MKKRLLILTYHLIYKSVKEKPFGYDSTFSINQDVFEIHLSTIRSVIDNYQLSNHQVSISFDDGFPSDFEIAFPLMEKWNLKALFFINHQNIKNENRWKQYREMIKYGHVVGSHGLTHVPFTRLSSSELINQFVDSRKIIEDKTGTECIDFSFPYGNYNRSVIKIGQRAGYNHFYSIRCNINSSENECLFHRFQVKSHYKSTFFENIVRAQPATMNYLRLKSDISFAVKQMFNRI